MTQGSEAQYPRSERATQIKTSFSQIIQYWPVILRGRKMIVAAFTASAVIGAAFGLEQRGEPVAYAAGAGLPISVPANHHLRQIPSHIATTFFVTPPKVARTPYGTRVSIPHLGVPAVIELTEKPLFSCDLITHTITQTIFVFDAEGQPVAGADVIFTVTRSDVDEPQLVSDTTGFDGAAHVTVMVPAVQANGSVPSYSILAEAFETHAKTPAAAERFSIHQYSCSAVPGNH